MLVEKTNMNNLFEKIDFIIEKISCLENIIPELQISKNENIQNNLMDLEQTSKYLYRSKNSIYKLVEKKKIPHSKNNKRLYFNREEINNWLRLGKRMTNEEMEEASISKLRNRNKVGRFNF